MNRQFPGSGGGGGGGGSAGGAGSGSGAGSGAGGHKGGRPNPHRDDAPFTFPSIHNPTNQAGNPKSGGFPNPKPTHGGFDDLREDLELLGASPEYSEYDALADLFLAESVIDPPALKAPKSLPGAGAGAGAPGLPGHANMKSAAMPTIEPGAGGGVGCGARIEGLILGHLPVLAAAWVAPYARHAADAAQQHVCLVRMQAGQISLDVFVPSGQSTSEIERLAQAGLDLSSSVRSLQATTGVWLLRVDDASEVDLAQSPDVSGLALLTGGDDAAVVASYRTLKGLAGVLPSAEHLDPTAVPVKITMVGTEKNKAEGAEARLRRAASTFLGLALPPFDRLDKVGASRGICVHRGVCPVGMQGLGELIGSLRAGGTGKAGRGAPAQSVNVAGTALGHSVGHAAGHAMGQIEMKPGKPLLSVFLPGLTGLDVACPYAPGVELALGEDGLHLLVSSAVIGATAGAAAGGIPVSEAVQRLLTAASWAEDHVGLLAAAHPVLAGSPRPVLHLFTDEPKAARGVLNTAMRVHLLAATASGREWVCRDLN